ncbi:hypothetical protein OH77DRAFT_247557 [Trametes cingulata]|nr:hypothetical protein OH77DRAFT_247557 [Trametes cingulata]
MRSTARQRSATQSVPRRDRRGSTGRQAHCGHETELFQIKRRVLIRCGHVDESTSISVCDLVVVLGAAAYHVPRRP